MSFSSSESSSDGVSNVSANVRSAELMSGERLGDELRERKEGGGEFGVEEVVGCVCDVVVSSSAVWLICNRCVSRLVL